LKNKLVFMAFAIVAVLGCSGLGTKWETVTEKNLTVEMPGKPEKQAQNIPSPVGTASGQMLTLDKGSEAYILAYHEFPAAISNLPIDPKTLLKGSADGAVRNVNGKVTSERDVTVGAHPGREIIGEGNKDGKNVEFMVRMYWAKPTLVQTLYLNEKGKGDKKNGTKFLDSLKIS
jgi:hypothetical protein